MSNSYLWRVFPTKQNKSPPRERFSDTMNCRMQSPTNQNDREKILVLLCSANIGNEPPDQLSLNAWIPRDGILTDVLEDQPYPIPDDPRDKCESVVESLPSEERRFLRNGEHASVGKDKFDIIAIGMQEATFPVATGENPLKVGKNATNLNTQTTDHVLGERFKEAKSNSTIEDNDRGDGDTLFLHQMLQDHLPSYTRVVSHQRGQMRLLIFYNQLEISLDVLSVQAQNTGKAGLPNKGGIKAECNINNGTRIALFSAHLEAHEGESKYKTRCSTLGDILCGTQSPVPDFHCDASLASHFTFFMGDLNFRTRLPNFEPGSQEHIEEAHRLAESKDWTNINKYDELAHAMEENDCLSAFKTLKCHFPPTFKVHRMDGYRYNEKRSPSYTDRILYNANHMMWDRIRPLAYEPIDHFISSDHKPVRGAFEIKLNSTLRWRPKLEKEYHNFPAYRENGQKVGGSNREKMEGEGDSLSRNENMHVRISSIQGHITCEKYSTPEHTPCTYVSFVSTPRDMMKVDTRSDKLLSFRGISQSLQNGDGSAMMLQPGWPRTRCAGRTCNPEWQDEVHFKVQTHYTNGTPMDLTGSMLHVLLLDSQENASLIGSCTVNLTFLISASRSHYDKNNLGCGPSGESYIWAVKPDILDECKDNASLGNLRPSNAADSCPANAKETSSCELSTRTNVANSSYDLLQLHVIRGSSSQEPGTSSGVVESVPSDALYNSSESSTDARNVTQTLLTRSVNATPGNRSSINSGDVHALKIDEPIMKNGRKVGRISFTFDTWWLVSTEATDNERLSS
jgi:hypothetical protein